MALMFLIASPLGLIYHKGQKIERTRYKVKWDKSFILIYLLFVLVTSVGLMMVGLSLQVGNALSV